MTRYNFAPILRALLMAGGLSLAPAHANLITNGSFETPVVPVGGFSNFLSGSTAITGWTVVGPEASPVSNKFVSLGITFPAEDGVQWLDLTGDISNVVEGVEQTIATSAGSTYALSYFVGDVIDPTTFYGSTSTVNVFINGTLIQTAVNSGGGKTLTWEQFTTSFVATFSSTNITFLNGDPRTDNSNGLDNVVVTLGSAAVPEPSTFTLCAAGSICAFGFFLLRKRGGKRAQG